jgi:hypothetical protein
LLAPSTGRAVFLPNATSLKSLRCLESEIRFRKPELMIELARRAGAADPEKNCSGPETPSTQPGERHRPTETVDEGWGQWLLDECVYRDRCWGGIGALHLSFARWCSNHGRAVPAPRRDFVSDWRTMVFGLRQTTSRTA